MISARKPPPQVERKAPVPLVNVEIVHNQDIQMTVNGYGTVRAQTTVQVVPQVSGKVLAVDPDFVGGGFFRASETLITIDPRDYELAVRRVEAAVARAQVRLDQEKAEAKVARREWQEIHPGRQPASSLVFHEPQIRQARAELNAALAELAAAQLNLERTGISLPFDGRVMQENVDRGQYLVIGKSVATVYGTDVVEIPIPLEDRELAWFDVPQVQGKAAENDSKNSWTKADVFADFAGTRHRWIGQVARIEGEVDRTSRMVRVVVKVRDPFNTDKGGVPLVPGMFVEVNIRGKMLNRVISVPRPAVHNSNEVWVVRAGKLYIQEVIIVRSDGNFAYVTSGLKDKDTIVTTPMDTVTDGMEVRTTTLDRSVFGAVKPARTTPEAR